MPGLSKSKYTKFCQCDKALWLKTYRPELEVIDEATKARFEMGNVVGDLAMGLFGEYKEAHAEYPDGKLDLAAMTEQTRQWMEEGVENICEASFINDDNYCAVDILRKTDDGWAIYEVKSSTYPEFKGRPSEIEKYAPDIAYQKWLLTQCGVNVTGTFLVCLNSDYVRHGDLDLQNLFVIIDMQGMVANELLKVPNNVTLAKKTMERADEPDTDIDNHCHSPYDCAFWDYCSRHLPKLSVFDVYGGKGKQFPFSKKVKLYKAGKIAFEDLRGESIGVVQDLQIACMLDQRDYIDREFISQFLSELYYPLYFLDFESMQDAIPQYDDAKPYTQLCFQYSLHIKESADAPYQHKEYLAPSDGSDPRRALAEQLCRDIPMEACTVVYNKTFECTRLKEMAEVFPDLSAHLLDIRDNIKDLLVPFQTGHFYLPAMGKSFSIKSVLPALFPDDPSLDYHNLSGCVKNGSEAMTIFPLIKDMPPAEAAATREALLRYCELDTWAMVKVWERLCEEGCQNH